MNTPGMKTVEQLLRETLSEAAEAAPSPRGVPDASTSPVRRHGRRRPAVLAIAAVVLAITAGLGVVGLVRPNGATPTPPPTGPVPPAGQRLIGFGQVAIAVPEGWKLNDFDGCGTPAADTIVIPEVVGVIAGCGSLQPPHVDDIVVDNLDGSLSAQWAAKATHRITLADGTPALRGRAWVRGMLPWAGDSETRRAVTVVVVPSLHAIAVGVSVAPGDLDTAMSRISRMPNDLAAVPAVPAFHANGRPDPARRWQHLASRLRHLGLVPRRQTTHVRNMPAGWIYGTTPGAGAVLRKGSTVVVHVSK